MKRPDRDRAAMVLIGAALLVAGGTIAAGIAGFLVSMGASMLVVGSLGLTASAIRQ